MGFEPLKHVESAAPIQWKGTTAKIENGVMLRTHEIANAGKPIRDGVERRRRPPTWTSTQDRGKTTVCLTFRN